MLLYYITDRSAFPGGEAERQRALLATIREAAAAGIDIIQLRERDLSARELEALAAKAVELLREFPETRLLVNSRIDVALARGAHGVHLRADDISAAEARKIWRRARSAEKPIIGVSCHSARELAGAEDAGADFAVLGPVFGKKNRKSQGREKPKNTFAPMGIEGLKKVLDTRGQIRSGAMPVLALGGVTKENASACLRAGAAGIAGIRIFQESELARVARELRYLWQHSI